MLLTQFILVDTHFILSLLGALAFFAIAWLYFDAWSANKKMKETTLFFGFLFLAVSFVAQSVIIDQALLSKSVLGADSASLFKNIFRIVGYLLLIFGEVTVPLQPVPEREKRTPTSVKALFVLPTIPYTLYAIFFLPILAATTAFLYLKRATIGLENHQKPIALGFFFLSFSEVSGLAQLFRDTNNINLLYFVGPFGVFWILERIFLAISIFIFGRWVFGYLLKRFDIQLFMIFTTTSLVIFLSTTIFFTYSTLNNLTEEAYNSIKTDVSVLNYSIDSKKNELISSAEVVAQNPEVAVAIIASDKNKLTSLTSSVLVSKKQSSLIVTGASGEIIIKAEDPEFSGGSLSSDGLVKRALGGAKAAGVSTKDGTVAPVVVISGAVPVKDASGKVIGTVMDSYEIDNAFVDGIKSATGLDASVYAENIRSATTFLSPDGVSRYIGIKEESTNIKKTVLSNGENYAGGVSILNTPYFASFAPLKNVEDSPIGMLFTARPQVTVLQTAAHSLELTFMVTVALLILSLIPAYFVSKYISEQIR